MFAGAEIAIVSMRRSRVTELAESGSRFGRALQALRGDPERFLATAQVAITVVGATAAVYGGARTTARIEALLADLPVVGPHAASVSLGLVVALVSYLSIVLGELVPKSLALRTAEGYSRVAASPLLGLSRLLRPIVWLLAASSNAVLRLFGDRTTFSEARVSPEELRMMVGEAARQGALDPRAGEIASRAIEFADLDAARVMVPRGAVVALPRNATADAVRRVFVEELHSRLPVYEGNIDNVVGYVTAKDVLARVLRGAPLSLDGLLRPPYFVPESMPAVDLLHELQRRRTPIAIIVDEVGSVVGIVTTEDLVEELVGDIFSEHDEPVEALLQREPDGAALVQGVLPIRDANRELGLDLPEGDGWTTIAGLCIHIAGNIPPAGTRLSVEAQAELEVVDASARRVRAVRIRPAPPPPEGEPGAG